jgi:hypothetical protein
MTDLDLPPRWRDHRFAARLLAHPAPALRPTRRRPRAPRMAPALAGAVLGTAAGCTLGAALAALLMVLPAQLRAAPAPGSTDTGFEAFAADWRRAVARADLPAVTAATRLPFLFEGRPLDAAGFGQQAWPALFTPTLRRCWARAPALAEPGARAGRALTCGAYTLHFDASGGAWRLREFSADGEN